MLSRFADAIMIRTDHHKKAEELAQYATVPVINGLTDLSHPCQILADMQTVIEQRAKLAGIALGVARRRQQCLQLADRGGVR